MVRKTVSKLKSGAENFYVTFFVSVVLFYSALSEVIIDLGDINNDNDIGVHHGVLLYAFVHVLKSLPKVLHGVEGIMDKFIK